MYLAVLILYSVICWMSALAYALATGEWRVEWVLLAGPPLISTVIAAVTLLEYLIHVVSEASIKRIRAKRRAGVTADRMWR